jgi:probable HAF family extracellular repeat protein
MRGRRITAFCPYPSAGRLKVRSVLMLAGCMLALLLLVAAPAFAGAADYGYAVMWDGGLTVPLGSLGGLNSRALDINRAGAIVGWGDIALGDGDLYPHSHAFLWQDGAMTDLGTLGGPNSCAYSINDKGEIAGVAQAADNTWHAAIWYYGSVTDLGWIAPADTRTTTFITRVLGKTSAAYYPATQINGSGNVAGSFSAASDAYRWHAFYWKSGAYKDLGAFSMPPSHVSYSYATALNCLGRVVGYSSYPGGSLDAPYEESRAFSWRPGTSTLQALPPLAGYKFGKAWAVNDLGLVAGDSHNNYSYPSGPLARATVWWGTSPLNLGTLGGEYSMAVGINSRNDVIGQSSTHDPDERHAFIKSVSLLDFIRGRGPFLPFKPMQDLGTLGGDRSFPNDLNYSRQVVGFSSAPILGATAALFLDHAFLWQGGTMTDLTPTAAKSEATAINAGGQVVGYLYPIVTKQ